MAFYMDLKGDQDTIPMCFVCGQKDKTRSCLIEATSNKRQHKTKFKTFHVEAAAKTIQRALERFFFRRNFQEHIITIITNEKTKKTVLKHALTRFDIGSILKKLFYWEKVVSLDGSDNWRTNTKNKSRSLCEFQ